MPFTTFNSSDSGDTIKNSLNTNFGLAATLASPTFTGIVTLPTGAIGVTQTAGDNSTKLATTAYADSTGGQCKTIFPFWNTNWGTATDGVIGRQCNVNTTMFIGQVVIPLRITVNKITFYATAVGATGALKVSLFSEDGQTQYFSITTASVSGAGNVSTSVSAVTIPAGIYYISILPVSTADVTVAAFRGANSYTAAMSVVSGKPIVNGYQTVAASTVPATITPTTITDGSTNGYVLVTRLDN